MTMRSKLKGALKNFYFTQGNSFSLGVNRFLICSLILFVYYFYRGHHAEFWVGVPDVYWMPIQGFRWFSIPRLSAPVLAMFDIVWFVSLLLTAIGFVTRYSSIVALICGAYLMGLPQNFGKVDTSDGPVLLMLLILAASRCGDAFSVDARLKGVPWLSNTKDVNYGWPSRAGQILFVCVFSAAGYSKLSCGGLAWMTSENMSNIFLQVHYTGLPSGRIGAWLADMPLLCWLMATSTVLFESCAWLALFSKRLSMLIVPTLFAMLVGFKLSLGHWPIYLFAMFVFWIPWHRLRNSGSSIAPD